MDELERGTIANPDEGRMVGHYWLRAPELAPSREIAEAIHSALGEISHFAEAIHSGKLPPPHAARFQQMLIVGIGGSALGPQFVADALGRVGDPITPHFFDNCDPDGMERVLARLGDALNSTLTIVISKSGGTKETLSGRLVAERAYTDAGLDFANHAVAITGKGSELDL